MNEDDIKQCELKLEQLREEVKEIYSRQKEYLRSDSMKKLISCLCPNSRQCVSCGYMYEMDLMYAHYCKECWEAAKG